MRWGFTAWVSLSAAVALAAPVASKQNTDVFLKDRTQRPLVDFKTLTEKTKNLVQSGRVSQVEPRFGVPSFYWAGRDPAFQSLRDQGVTAEQAARRYLFAYAGLYRLDAKGSAEKALARVSDHGDGAVIVTFQLPEHGRLVMGEELKVIMDQRLQLVALSGWLSPARKVNGSFNLSETTAIAQAYFDLTGKGLETNRIAALPQSPTDTNYRHFNLAGESHPARVRPVYFVTTEGLKPAWYVELHLANPEDTSSLYFSYVVSAHDGSIFKRNDLTRYDSYSYRVWADPSGNFIPFDGPQGNDPSPHPTGTLNQYHPGYVAPNLVSVPYTATTITDPWLPASATQTQGNNTFAYADINAPDGYSSGDPVPTPTAAGVFDRTYDTSKNPGSSTDQRDAAVTQMFYDVNFFHDWYYDVGFDEVSFNAQTDNFNRGGVAGDPVLAEGQDYSGKNNSNMQTPADGASPVMQMYVFDGGGGAQIFVIGGSNVVYHSGASNFGPQTYNVNADAALITSSSGLADGCSAALANVTGKIAVVQRGNCQFTQKVTNAQQGGAVGIIIVNNQAGQANDLFGTGSFTIPVLSMSQADGQDLQTRAQSGPVNLTLSKAAVIDFDGTIDNTIVAHEWGHYIQNRLIGNGNGLGNNQGGGMGEGWSDFHAMLMVVKDSDRLVASNPNFSGVYALAGYTMYGETTDSYYWGIRRVPYSTDMTKNGLTFRMIADGNPLPTTVPAAFDTDGSFNSEVHNTGEVWATLLWECYAALLRDTPTRLSFDEANYRMRKYIVDAYKGTPVNPTVLEARDALLAVASANDPVDYGEFWSAFAKRGAGMLATGPDSGSQDNNPVMESYVAGNALQIGNITLDDSVSSCDHDGVLDNNETGMLTISVKNTGTGVLMNTVVTLASTNPGVTLGASSLNLGTSQPFQEIKSTVPVTLHGIVGKQAITVNVQVNDPQLAVAGPVISNAGFRVNYDVNATGSATDDVEAPTTVWTASSDTTLTTGEDFHRLESSATEHWWFGPDSPSPADAYLISPPLHVSATGDFSVEFDQRYWFEYDQGMQVAYDGAVIELSTDNGVTWLDVGAKLSTGYTGTLDNGGANPLGGRQAFTGQSPGYPMFAHDKLDLGTAYAGQTVLLRFRIGSDDAVAEKGWELDNLAFTGIDDKPFATVVNDPNECTNTPPVLTVGADQTVPEGTMVTLTATATDADNDPVTITWSQSGGPTVALTDNTFVAPAVTADTVFTFQAIATDGKAVVGPQASRVTVKNENHPPVVTVSPATATVDAGATVTLNATATDPDGDTLGAFNWAQTGGATVTLDGLGTATVTFVAPKVDADTHFTIQVKVNDGVADSAPAVADILVKGSKVTDPGTKKKTGCGCNEADGLVPLLALLALGLKRRKK